VYWASISAIYLFGACPTTRDMGLCVFFLLFYLSKFFLTGRAGIGHVTDSGVNRSVSHFSLAEQESVTVTDSRSASEKKLRQNRNLTQHSF
jgi:hypothetical protein